MRAFLKAGVPAVLAMSAACAVGPNYERPTTVAAPLGWRDTTLALRDSSYANLPWWEIYADTTLQGLIRTSLRENRDPRVAIARVNESRALLGIQRIQFLPQIDIVAGVSRKDEADSLLGGAQRPENLGTVGAELSWEIDLWGRLRRLNEAAKARLLATEHGRRGAILTVVSEVARTYLELRDFDQELFLAEQQVELRRQSTGVGAGPVRGRAAVRAGRPAGRVGPGERRGDRGEPPAAADPEGE